MFGRNLKNQKLLVSHKPNEKNTNNIFDKNWTELYKEILVPATPPQWFKNLETPNPDQNLEGFMEVINGKSTNAKFCPSFIELFKNSYLVKSPVEFVLTFKSNDEITLTMPSTERYYLTVEGSHNLNSQTNGGLKDYLNLKISTPLVLKTNKFPLNLTLLSPTYYNDFPCEVAPGILTLNSEYFLPLNINYIIPRYLEKRLIGQSLFFPKGHVLAILYAGSKAPIKFVDNILKYKLMPQYHFFGNYFKNIKNNLAF
jgi:hypothetical protein